MHPIKNDKLQHLTFDTDLDWSSEIQPDFVLIALLIWITRICPHRTQHVSLIQTQLIYHAVFRSLKLIRYASAILFFQSDGLAKYDVRQGYGDSGLVRRTFNVASFPELRNGSIVINSRSRGAWVGAPYVWFWSQCVTSAGRINLLQIDMRLLLFKTEWTMVLISHALVPFH